MSDLALAAPAGAAPTRAGVLRRFARHRLALLGVVVLALMVAASALAPWLAPAAPDDIDTEAFFGAPFTASHWLGTDDLGRDVLTRLMYAGRISLAVGVSAMLVTVVLGFAIGAFAAYHGGWLDAVLMRFTDMMLCFPPVFLLLFVAAFVTPTLGSIALMIGATSWMEIARLVHAQIQALKSADFIAAARMAGSPSWRIVLRQILPNTLAPLLVAATLNTANAILLESYISYLGYGIHPPDASWGNMLTNAQDAFQVDAWLAVFPGVAITLAVASCNFIGDGLRDALDPRLTR